MAQGHFKRINHFGDSTTLSKDHNRLEQELLHKTKNGKLKTEN